jgi:cytoskeleton protein RodZ
VTDQPATMGAYLRAARRKRRVGIERAAEETRIRADFLMRMESDEFDFLAQAYVRGFLKTYARFLRVDPDPLMEEFDRRFGARVDTAQMIALEKHGRRTRLERPRLSSNWTAAALFAGFVLLILAVVGLVSEPTGDEGPENAASQQDETPTPEPTDTPTATPTPTPTPTPTDIEDIIATADAIELEVVATTGRCWTTVTADGEEIFTGTLEVGQSEVFNAEEKMDVVLGNAGGVELIVNGQNIGSPGGTVVDFSLPQDVDSLT